MAYSLVIDGQTDRRTNEIVLYFENTETYKKALQWVVGIVANKNYKINSLEYYGV